jgi:plasmid stability protein
MVPIWYHTTVPTLTVKNMPSKLYDRLKRSAKEHHRSLNAEIIACVERVLEPAAVDAEEYLAKLDALHRRLELPELTADLLESAKRSGRP